MKTKQISFSFSDQVAPLFNSQVINYLCEMIDDNESKGKKTEDFKRDLLHIMENAADLTNPINKNRKEVYEYVKSTI